MIWHKTILSNLIEAHGDLKYLQARMVYLATGKALSDDIPCSRQYFRCLFCFPRAFPELWPKTIPMRRRHENAP